MVTPSASSSIMAMHSVVAKDSASKHVSVVFLERLKTEFRKRYGGGKADTATAKSLNKEFGPVIKEHMQYVIDHADETEKLLKVKAQVSEVKNIMFENIEKVIDRGEKLKDLRKSLQIYIMRLKDSRNKEQNSAKRCGCKT